MRRVSWWIPGRDGFLRNAEVPPPWNNPMSRNRILLLFSLVLALAAVVVRLALRGGGEDAGDPGERLVADMVPIPGRVYFMGKYEVTQAQWEAVMGGNQSFYKGADHPV